VGLMVGTLLALAAPLTYAQTTTPATDVTTQAAPGVPSTGMGGDAAANLAILGLSAAVLAAGGLYLARSRKEA
jgi:LPXTG-motif cell wall-anchored protein